MTQGPLKKIFESYVSLKLKISSPKDKSPPAARYLDQITDIWSRFEVPQSSTTSPPALIWAKYRAAGGDLSLSADS